MEKERTVYSAEARKAGLPEFGDTRSWWRVYVSMESRKADGMRLGVEKIGIQRTRYEIYIYASRLIILFNLIICCNFVVVLDSRRKLYS